jgi:ABC-type polysaccharide/polyol phosphate transport system ATPase subunit
MSNTNEISVRVTGLSKMFKLYARPVDMFRELVTGKPKYKPFWALKDISFEVHRGQVVGIMGRNGAGKSTLLKIVTGKLDATEGSVAVKGRISSILELGTGFNAEYSGRENIYLGGLMVGLTREEILGKMDWIIKFSELEDFIDQPFKTYSTGMQARLTFSTAVCVDPDILIVDEALSVGDARFQRKSFGKIEEFRNAGRTILLVSHDTNTISTFCNHAILLENGKVFEQGEPQHISKVYYSMLFPSKPAASTSDEVADSQDMEIEITLDNSKFVPELGYAWQTDLSAFSIRGDSEEHPEQSKFVLYENDTPLRPPHTPHSQIREFGRGAFSHWGKILLFSTPDHSDPRSNGREYCLRHKALLKKAEIEKSLVSHEHRTRDSIRRRALQILGLGELLEGDTSRQLRMGNKKAEILDFGILDDQDARTTNLVSGAQYAFFLRAVFFEDVDRIVVGFLVRSLKGVDLFGTTTALLENPVPPQRAGDILEVGLDVTMWLTNGIYFLTTSIGSPDTEAEGIYDIRYDGLQFMVGQRQGIFTTSVVDLEPKISTKTLANAAPAEKPGYDPR